MAKQPEDTQTVDMLPQPKKRGRPKSPHALSAAERMRLMRDRNQLVLSRKDLSDVPVTVLLEHLGVAVRKGLPGSARRLADELVVRSKQSKQD